MSNVVFLEIVVVGLAVVGLWYLMHTVRTVVTWIIDRPRRTPAGAPAAPADVGGAPDRVPDRAAAAR